MITLFLEGLVFGIWLLGAMTPLLLLAAVVGATLYRLFREEYIDAATFIEDFPPEIPTSEPEPEPPRHRFIASTIVRPPNIHKVSDEDSEEKP